MTNDDIRALANRFFNAVEAGDIDVVVGCYAPAARIWHNNDQLEQSREENRNTLMGMASRIRNRIYDDRRIEIFPGGFVQQHVLRGTRIHDDVQVYMPACVVCRVANGVITRLDEYFDSAHVAQFRKYADK